MKLTISKDANPNYLAKIVKIETFKPHPKADRLKLAVVDGCVISTGIDNEPGTYVYFPLECQINKDFLAENNMFRDKTLNDTPDATPGFFEENRRVKCIKLRGLASEGLLMPIKSLQNWIKDFKDCEDLIGTEFDTINDTLFVNKYVPKQSLQQGSGKNSKRNKEKKYEDIIVDNQFRFHDDTEMLKKNVFKLELDDIIHISQKFHGTSGIFCNLLVNKELSTWQKILKGIGANVITTEYKTFCSSRKVVKDPNINKTLGSSYYSFDIWNATLEVLKPYLIKGMSIYAEIVGYLPNGNMIQKDFDYGCEYLPEIYNYNEMTPQQMYEKGLFKIYVYRITQTNVDGKVFEFGAHQLQKYCHQIGLIPVIEEYYGTINNYMFNTAIGKWDEKDWQDKFIETLSTNFLEKECIYCKNKVPAEGVVLRVDKPKFEAYKLKSLAFYEKETKMLDAGIVDIETQES